MDVPQDLKLNPRHEQRVPFLHSLTARFLTILLLATVLPLLFSGGLAYFQSRQAVYEQVVDQLVTMRTLKAERLQAYFRVLEEDVVLTSKFLFVRESLRSFAQVEDFYEVRLLGYVGRPDMVDSEQGTLYDELHARYYEQFMALITTKAYGEVYLVRPDGMVVYNYGKGADFATSLLTGSYRDTHLADLFRELRTSTNTNEVRFTDFVLYGPSGGMPVSFVGTPVIEDGVNVGVLIYRVPLPRIDEILLSQTGVLMGDTGQVYLVGPDKLMRTNLYQEGRSLLMEQVVDNHAVRAALTGESGAREVIGYAGEPVLTAYTPVSFGGQRWALVAEIRIVEALQPIRQLQMTIMGIIGVALLIGGGLGWLAMRAITTPIVELTEVATAIAGGDVARSVPVRSRGETGLLAAAFRTMTERLRRLIAQLESRVQERTQALEQRTAYLEASMEVGHVAASTLDMDILMQQVVDLIQERLDVYYVGLFLVGQSQEWAELQVGTGDVGRQLRARGLRVPVGKGSLVGSSIMHRRAYVIRDVTQDTLRMALPELPDTRAEVALPLQVRGEVIGALTVEDTRVGTFDTAMVSVLQSMVDQVAVALQNARLFSELQVALEAERRAYGEMIGEAWAERLRAQGELHYVRELDGQVRALRGDQPSPEVLAAQREGARIAGKQASVALPIKVRDLAVGAIQFRKPEAAQSWSAGELELLETLIEQLGVALESARLYDDTQRRAAREQLTGEITGRIRESLDVEQVLQIAVREIGNSLGIETEVWLGAEEDQGGTPSSGGERL